jgi:hypothetical protein
VRCAQYRSNNPATSRKPDLSASFACITFKNPVIAPPHLFETAAGMLNSIGLQNIGARFH